MKPIKIYNVGERLKLIKDLWDDGCDGHHPAYYVAIRGDVGIVEEGGKNPIVQLETGTKALLRVYFDEIDEHKE